MALPSDSLVILAGICGGMECDDVGSGAELHH